jgi:hypothetical protein
MDTINKITIINPFQDDLILYSDVIELGERWRREGSRCLLPPDMAVTLEVRLDSETHKVKCMPFKYKKQTKAVFITIVDIDCVENGLSNLKNKKDIFH